MISAGRLWLPFLLLPGLSSISQPTPPGPSEVTFAQLTDAHIFDDGWKQPVPQAMRQAANDRDALIWAIGEINREVNSGKRIDFVVYTGDLGLQNVAFAADGSCQALPLSIQPGLPPTTLPAAVEEIAEDLNSLAVRTIYFLPGNNDVENEDVTDGRFGCFMAQLQDRVRAFSPALTVTELHADRSVLVNGVRIAGLDTASFKKQSNYEAACSPASAANDPTLKEACPQLEIDALKRMIDEDPNSPVLLFTHVPDVMDPYFHSRNPGVRKSTWDIQPQVRAVWEKEACSPSVLAIFAGHFHDSNRAVYGSNVTTQDLAYSECIADKTWIAPPLALKNQENKSTTARGFLLVTVSAGKIDARAHWANLPDHP
jgi:predicted MPP superfamily phosphohydrolase